MTSFDILFQTNRFNLSEAKEHFINPCCFGEDLAEWLREQLAKKGVSADAPYQEDWGGEMPARQGSQGYFLGATECPSEGAVDKNDGEWRIMWRRGARSGKSFGARTRYVRPTLCFRSLKTSFANKPTFGI